MRESVSHLDVIARGGMQDNAFQLPTVSEASEAFYRGAAPHDETFKARTPGYAGEVFQMDTFDQLQGFEPRERLQSLCEIDSGARLVALKYQPFERLRAERLPNQNGVM